MTKKLTLTIDDRVIEFAKAYASRTRQSVSSIVEHYFERLGAEVDLADLSPQAAALYGSLENSPLPDKHEIHAQFHEKDSD